MKQAYNKTSEEIMLDLGTSENGLNQAQIAASRSEHGSNSLVKRNAYRH
jgi:hypothetical protein